MFVMFSNKNGCCHVLDTDDNDCVVTARTALMQDTGEDAKSVEGDGHWVYVCKINFQ